MAHSNGQPCGDVFRLLLVRVRVRVKVRVRVRVRDRVRVRVRVRVRMRVDLVLPVLEDALSGLLVLLVRGRGRG